VTKEASWLLSDDEIWHEISTPSLNILATCVHLTCSLLCASMKLFIQRLLTPSHIYSRNKQQKSVTILSWKKAVH